MPGLELLALVNREAAAEPGAPWFSVPHKVVPVNARNRIEWVRGEQFHVPRLAGDCDLIHSLASTAPLHSRARRITTIHDLTYKLVPDAHFGLRALGMRLLVPASARRSHRIIVDAESTKRDLAEHLGTPAAKVDVAPLGVTPTPPVAPTPAADLRARLDLGDGPVLLTVSAKRPHKNLLRLLEAVALLESRPDARPAGIPDPARGRAARQGRRARGAGGLPAVGVGRGPGGPVRARRGVRVPLARGGLRVAGARGDVARRAGRLQRPFVAARGRR